MFLNIEVFVTLKSYAYSSILNKRQVSLTTAPKVQCTQKFIESVHTFLCGFVSKCKMKLVFNCKFLTLNKQTVFLSFSKKGLRQKQNHIRFLSYLIAKCTSVQKLVRNNSFFNSHNEIKTSFQMFNPRSLFLSYFLTNFRQTVQKLN